MHCKMPKQAAILANAERLISDAQLLVSNGRCASAYALSVLALEEIGKAILEVWDVKKHTSKSPFVSSHIKKQSAVSVLLIARYSIEYVGNLEDRQPEDDEELAVKMAASIMTSDEGKFDRHVAIGAIDKTKQLAIYRDEWFEAIGAYDIGFDISAVTRVFDRCRTAIVALNDPKTMHVGAAIYNTRKSDGSKRSSFPP
jgi:AbiV family abortive infection protein